MLSSFRLFRDHMRRSKRRKVPQVQDNSVPLDESSQTAQDAVRVSVIPAAGDPMSILLRACATVSDVKRAVMRHHGFEIIHQEMLPKDGDAPLAGSVRIDQALQQQQAQATNNAADPTLLSLYLVLRDPPFRWSSCGHALAIGGDSHEHLSGTERLVHTGRECIYGLGTGSEVAAAEGALGR